MGERIAPVSEYCDAFRQWAAAIGEKLQRDDLTDDERRVWEPIRDALLLLEIPIAKSNLLARLIYDGQKLRKRECPVHKGRWSGYNFPENPPCECQDGWDLTGWLPEQSGGRGE